MNTTAESAVADQRRTLVVTGSIVFIGWLGDFLFWQHSPGISVGIFFAAIAAAVMFSGNRTRRSFAILTLLLGSCIQSGIELCFTNIASLVLLTIALVGETAYSSLITHWARWSEAGHAILVGVFRWSGLVQAWAITPWSATGRQAILSPSLGRAVRASVPALFLALTFAVLLASGNAILAEGFSRFGSVLKSWLLEVSFGRTVMWLIWLTVGVTFLWPPSASHHQRWWTRAIPHWHRADERLARWQSAMILGLVNTLFFAANTIDAIFLWADGKLPADVSY
ncbi:MAG TPA: DUF4153 domain-containing protein, partial [Chthoniobacteraceae bacterium]|nr:DUF4153 domain-containing protein [Chthoniobacteraceae bacterium]